MTDEYGLLNGSYTDCLCADPSSGKIPEVAAATRLVLPLSRCFDLPSRAVYDSRPRRDPAGFRDDPEPNADSSLAFGPVRNGKRKRRLPLPVGARKDAEAVGNYP